MPFVDLEDSFPSEPGTYKVKIQTTTGTREAEAKWNAPGFELINDTLGDDEYIFEWFRD
jgi:hypothetical protein